MANLPDFEEVQTPAQLAANLKSDFETMDKSDLPHFEEEPREKAGKNWSLTIHDFHMAGERTLDAEAACDQSPLVPALLGQLERDGRLEPEYPYFLPNITAGNAAPEPVASLLETVLHRCEKDGVETQILTENLPSIVRFLDRYDFVFAFISFLYVLSLSFIFLRICIVIHLDFLCLYLLNFSRFKGKYLLNNSYNLHDN